MLYTISQLDWQLFSLIHSWGTYNAFTHQLFYILNYVVVALIVFYVAAYIIRHRAHTVAIALGISACIGYLLSRFIGFLYFRPRPFVTHDFIPIVSASEFSKSFPSSHATVAFALAFGLYLYNKKWGKWALVMAATIALLRPIVGVHYPIDIIAGAGLGMLVSYTVTRFLKR